MNAAPHLRVVDAETGEIPDDCPSCKILREQLAGAERDLRAWRSRYAKAVRDKEAEARSHDLWKDAEKLFSYWRRRTGRTRPQFTADRFWLVLPFLLKDGADQCRRAIYGRAYDHYEARRKNGSIIRYYEWERIFGSRGEFEESVNRCPSDADTLDDDAREQEEKI